MNINVLQEEGQVPITVFQVEGRINLGNADELTRRAEKAHGQGMSNLILDLSEVESLTSAGLRAILTILKMLGADSAETVGPGAKSRHLKLVRPSSYVMITLTTAGFDRYLEIYESLPDAVASFQA